jgi:hypothetical protein
MAEPTKLESALDELLAGKTTEEIVGPDGLLKRLTKTLIERKRSINMDSSNAYGETLLTQNRKHYRGRRLRLLAPLQHCIGPRRE